MTYVCDYTHDNDEQGMRPAEVWTQDIHGAWTPLCGPCLPEFWRGGDREDGPWVVYPIHVIPPGPKRLRQPDQVPYTVPDSRGNRKAREGCDRCACGCKYWENDRCIDCGTQFNG